METRLVGSNDIREIKFLKPSEKEEALDALNRKIRGQESVAGTLANQITESCARFASTADERKRLL